MGRYDSCFKMQVFLINMIKLATLYTLVGLWSIIKLATSNSQVAYFSVCIVSLFFSNDVISSNML
jgi:hypothetical protein